MGGRGRGGGMGVALGWICNICNSTKGTSETLLVSFNRFHKYLRLLLIL